MNYSDILSCFDKNCLLRQVQLGSCITKQRQAAVNKKKPAIHKKGISGVLLFPLQEWLPRSGLPVNGGVERNICRFSDKIDVGPHMRVCTRTWATDPTLSFCTAAGHPCKKVRGITRPNQKWYWDWTRSLARWEKNNYYFYSTSFSASSIGIARRVSMSISSARRIAIFIAIFSLGASNIATESYLPRVQ